MNTRDENLDSQINSAVQNRHLVGEAIFLFRITIVNVVTFISGQFHYNLYYRFIEKSALLLKEAFLLEITQL